MHAFLHGLNEDQLLAVTSPAQGQLQIVAGPGTGKTRVIAARVAYLIVECGIPPSSIIVTTFTKKAANEMRERVASLLAAYPNINVKSILMGTFHSICFRIIVASGYSDYTIANERDAKALLTDAIASVLSSSDDKDDVRKMRRAISTLKANATSADMYTRDPKRDARVALVYREYQERLDGARRLDFDDCLLVCLRILCEKPVLAKIRHVLVDEFQDTNIIQLQLMYAFAHAHNVTVVGDPDQGIYAFRDACASNFASMRLHYHGCVVVELSHNYRLTPAIVNIAETIMRQQRGRSPRAVTALTLASFEPVLFEALSSSHEARWVAAQIARLAAASELLLYSDIAILVRSSHQTRALESALAARKIPYVMVKGTAFWDRREVVAILDYMRLVANEGDNDRLALQRAINYPKRGLGEKTWLAISQKLDKNPLRLSQILPGACAWLGAKAGGTVRDFWAMISDLRSLLQEKGSIDAVHIKAWFDALYKSSGLEAAIQSDQQAALNIQEVGELLCKYEPAKEDLSLFSNDDDEITDPMVFVARFIQSLGLYETVATLLGDTAGIDPSRGQVAISTIHGAKGLEWPAVFVPGLCESLLPSKFALDQGGDDAIDEERRTLYVASTRARALLYFSFYTETEGKWGGSPIEACSRFVEGLGSAKLVTTKQRALESDENVRQLYTLLGKTCPDNYSYDQVSEGAANGGSGRKMAPVPEGGAGFTTARHAIAKSVLAPLKSLAQPHFEHGHSVSTGRVDTVFKQELIFDAFARQKGQTTSSCGETRATTLAGLTCVPATHSAHSKRAATGFAAPGMSRNPVKRFAPAAAGTASIKRYAPNVGTAPKLGAAPKKQYAPRTQETRTTQHAPRSGDSPANRPFKAPAYAPRR